MTVWLGLIAILIAMISPALAVLYLIPISGNVLVSDTQKSNRFFLIWFAVCVFFYLTRLADQLMTLDIVCAGVACFLLFYLIRIQILPHIIFMLISFFLCIYVAIRQVSFAEYIALQYNKSAQEILAIVGSRYPSDSEQYLLLREMIAQSKDVYISYGAGAWLFLCMLCIMIGYFILYKGNKSSVSIGEYQTHKYVVYSLIVALAVAVITQYKVVAINYMLGVSPLFFIQGMGVVDKVIGKWYRNNVILKVIGIACLMINPYILLFISVIGLFDNWFDFRKLSIQEEVNENNLD